MKLFGIILLFVSLLCSLPSGVYGGAALDVLSALPAAEDVYEAIECEQETRSSAECNLGFFTGVYVCRHFFTAFGIVSEHNVCVRNFADGVTLGFSNDKCGCCGEKCPDPCACDCGSADENGVYSSKLIRPVLFMEHKLPAICVPNGIAEHLTYWGGRVQCETECPAEDASEDGDDED